jgi:hypothetical protein
MQSRVDEPSFELRGFQPNESRPIVFQCGKLGKAVVIHYDDKSPRSMTVTVEPWMTVTGRFVGDDGLPIKWPAANVAVEIGSQHALRLGPSLIDWHADGRFAFNQVAPGAKSYSISVYGFDGTVKVVPVAGKTLALGDIKVKREK